MTLDFNYQILERTLERERDENKKQKQKRESTEKTIFELIQKISKVNSDGPSIAVKIIYFSISN